MTFEEKLKKLEELANRLESENLTLEDSVNIYQEAKLISQELTKELNDSMEKLSYIVENGQIKPFDSEEVKKDI